MENVSIYIVTYKNPMRKERMKSRFDTLNLHVEFIEGDDLDLEEKYQSVKRTWEIMESHKECIKRFYNSEKSFAIICEDDIFLHTHFVQMFEEALKKFEQRDLDILLLSYLINSSPENFGTKIDEGLYNYSDNLWGAHCYVISKKYAKFILETFTLEWAKTNDHPFCSDWIITKNGNRAFVYPPLAVEEGLVGTDHYGQVRFHQECKEFLFNENYI